MKNERLRELYKRDDPDLREALDEVRRLHTALEFIAAWTAGAMINGRVEAMVNAGEEALKKIRDVNAGWRRPGDLVVRP